MRLLQKSEKSFSVMLTLRQAKGDNSGVLQKRKGVTMAAKETDPIKMRASGSEVKKPASSFPIVGIGASAGGLEALGTFL